MSIKTVEAVKVVNCFRAERYIGTANTIYYNGVSVTDNAGVMIDTSGYDDVVFALNVGTITGTAATLSNAIYESDTDDPTAATALDGADFADGYAASDEKTMLASVQCKDTKRYLCLRSNIQTSSSLSVTVDFSAFAVLGKPDIQPITQEELDGTDITLDFDL